MAKKLVAIDTETGRMAGLVEARVIELVGETDTVPAGGWPKSSLSQTVQLSLDLADAAMPGSWRPSAADITDSTATGRAVVTASSAAAARSAIGAGTSSLSLGTTSSTAKRGDWRPAAANITDATAVGRNVLKASSAAAARSAIGAGTSSLSLGTTSSTAMAGNRIQKVASLPANPDPLILYCIPED